MSTLRARFGLQGLDHHGVAVADQPGLVLKGKQLSFYSLHVRPPGAEDPLRALRTQFSKAVDDARRETELANLHLYYLDADGHAILSLPGGLAQAPTVKLGTKFEQTTPLTDMRFVRRYEAVGKTGLRFRTKEEIRDVYTIIEMYQTAFQLGWGGQFFARDPEARTTIFRHFDPLRSGLIRVEEKVTNLTCTIQLFQESGQDLVAYRPVKTSLEAATLAEALAWS